MQVSKEEILHIANLAKLELKEEEIEQYRNNLDKILEYTTIINNAPIDKLDITIGANALKNVFRKDEIKVFDNMEGLLQNAPSKENNMYKVPKIL